MKYIASATCAAFEMHISIVATICRLYNNKYNFRQRLLFVNPGSVVYNRPMKRAKPVLPIFLLLLLLAGLLFVFQGSLLKPLQAVTTPIQRWVYTSVSTMPMMVQSEDMLLQENNDLRIRLAKYQEMERDNKALRDQFKTTNPNPRNVLPATIIGVNENQLFLDKGQEDNVQQDDIVVLKDTLIGKVEKVSPHVAIVTLITHPLTSFTAETAKTLAIGVVKAQGGDTITLENVVLSDKLEKDDLVMTKGDVDEKGGGFPPNLVVGKVVSVNKKASNLFQSAQVKSLVDFNKIRMVFVVTN